MFAMPIVQIIVILHFEMCHKLDSDLELVVLMYRYPPLTSVGWFFPFFSFEDPLVSVLNFLNK